MLFEHAHQARSALGAAPAALEDEKIITHRDDATDSYKSNEFWRSRLSGIEDAQKNELDLILQQFSRSYDYFIDSFANDYIQVAGVERPLGLFDFVFFSVDFFILIDAIKSDASFDVFFQWCVEFFWKNIEASLQAVRTHIDRVLKQKLNEMFVALQQVSLLLSVRIKPMILILLFGLRRHEHSNRWKTLKIGSKIAAFGTAEV